MQRAGVTTRRGEHVNPNKNEICAAPAAAAAAQMCALRTVLLPDTPTDGPSPPPTRGAFIDRSPATTGPRSGSGPGCPPRATRPLRAVTESGVVAHDCYAEPVPRVRQQVYAAARRAGLRSSRFLRVTRNTTGFGGFVGGRRGRSPSPSVHSFQLISRNGRTRHARAAQ